MITYKDLLILKLSQTTQWKNEIEMIIPKRLMEVWDGSTFTCEFINLKKRTYILRSYYKSGVKCWRYEYQNNRLHGQSISWYKSGAKHWQQEYKKDRSHGRFAGWYKNRAKCWQSDWKNGQLHGYSIR